MSRLLNIRKYKGTIWHSEEKEMKLSKRDIRPIRWFILLWASIVYLWGCTQLLLGDYVRLPLGGSMLIIIQTATALKPKPPVPFQKPDTELPSMLYVHKMYPYQPPALIGVMLMIFQFCLHWLCLSGKLQRNWYWLYFLLQGLCTLAISFVWPDMTITLGLYLVLVIEAVSLVKQLRQIIFVVASYLVLFMLTIVWQLMNLAIWMTLESALLLIIFIIGWVILSIQQVHARGALEAAHLQLAAYAMRVEELTLLNERQRLARELHDTLAQDLVGLTLQLERVDLHLDKKRFERARELVQQAMARTRATLAEARSAIDDLRANTPGPDDLLLAIQREIKRFTETTSIVCEVDIADLAMVPENLCEHVLRAITEGLMNVARHAQAHHVWVCTQFSGTMLTIEVRDDGTGFDSAAIVTQDKHYGLLGLRERARLIGGHLDIESAPGKGTILRLHLPVNCRGGLD